MNTSVISVRKLCKTFSVLQKEAGFAGGIKSLFFPRYQEVKAVNDISFDVTQGECIAFIGPNGAGKSTTTKIMTGILHATSGNVSVLGLDPVKNRMKLAFKMGTVFGQKSQLWYHLPPMDTYTLLAHIYELKPAEFKARLDFLSEKFELESFLETPVRKLSLGERMRCELVGSLLHRPQVLFLDEPTIGLDIIAKQHVRDLLSYLNKEEGVTIFLTSHDVGDIEKLTDRTIIINHGSVVFDDSTEQLKKNFITSKVVDLVLEEKTDAFAFAEGTLLEKTPHTVKIQLDGSAASTERLLAYALENFTLVDITIHDTPLEQIIAQIYQQEAGL